MHISLSYLFYYPLQNKNVQRVVSIMIVVLKGKQLFGALLTL